MSSLAERPALPHTLAAYIGFLAILNALSGWLGLKLAIPPGYVTAMFPPAGIALGALLLWGHRVWPGVFIGSLALNITVGLLSSSGLSGSALNLSLIIAGGSTLQALAGYALVQRWLPGAQTLRNTHQMVPLLLLGGPLACLVASGVGSLALVALGKSSWAAWPFSIWSWWVGDTIGVILFTPLMLVLGNLSEAQGRWRALIVAVPSISMLGLVVVLFFQANIWENQRIETSFHDQARIIVSNLSRDLERYQDAVRSTRGLFESSSDVTPAQFAHFTADILHRNPAILALELIPSVSAQDRAAFEQRAQQLGMTGFAIWERNAAGAPVPAGRRERYFPVFYLEPTAGNELVAGFDIGSSPARRDAILQANERHQLAATPKVTLVNNRHQGVLMMAPVDSGARSGSFVLGAFTLDAIATHAIPAGLSPDIVTRLDDVTDSVHPELLYQSLQKASTYAGLQWQIPLQFANRQWLLQLSASEGFAASHRSSVSWMVLAGGLLSTGVLQMLLLVLTSHTRNIEIEVKERTDELAQSEARFRAIFSDNPDAILLVAQSGLIVGCNARTLSLFGYSEGQLDRQPIEFLLPERFHARHVHNRNVFLQQPVLRPMGVGLSLFARRADGSEFPVDVMLSPMHLADQTLTIAIVRDITERRKLESARDESVQRMNEALKEKETLLQEVYHRVKNNLQVVQSLLSLESHGLASGPARAALEDTATRIQAMALVHEKLYQSPNLASISLADYVQELLNHLGYSSKPRIHRIAIRHDIADIQIGLDTAIPLGLLLNELVSNSLKHGFPDERQGEVRVIIEAMENEIKLTVADNGIGLPADLVPDNAKTMGLRLATTLARQLGGRLGNTPGDGASFTTTFKYTPIVP